MASPFKQRVNLAPSITLPLNARCITRLSYFFLIHRSKDTQLPSLPTKVVLDCRHNHPVYCADALEFRDVKEEAKAKLKALFQRKYGPTQAVEMLKLELQMEHGDKYLEYAADRAICPDIQFAHR